MLESLLFTVFIISLCVLVIGFMQFLENVTNYFVKKFKIARIKKSKKLQLQLKSKPVFYNFILE